jgi:TolB protein
MTPLHARTTPAFRVAILGLIATLPVTACDDAVGPDEPLLAELIAFEGSPSGSIEDADRDLYVMRPDGSGVVRLTVGMGAIAPAWSPDGTTIAFSSAVPGDWNVYLIDADGSNLRALTTGPDWKYHPTWSPDGERLAFRSDSAGGGIYTIRADGTAQTLLTTCDHHCMYPSWSPDGSRLALAWWVEEEGVAGVYIPNVMIVDADGSNPHMLGTGMVKENKPAWSRDGSTLVFAGSATSGGGYDLYAVDPDGGGTTRLTTDRTSLGATFSRDGSRIMFGSARDGPTTLYVMNADGTDPQRITALQGRNERPSWRP